ncbi:MAG TPA: HPF/RaiA family ribosome-associated protein [Burkholderiaceae bacterium]|nr:HPF/RaiA family ribosome-associated protein [Burkholderiaceae bacterium]
MDAPMLARECFLTPPPREHLERHLRFAFSGARDRIARTVVHLRDLSGPRGGRDKLCQVSMIMPDRPEVVIRVAQEDMYNAIDCTVRRAANRATRLVARRRLRGVRFAVPVEQ